jgi:uncharacterized membrane protein
MFGVGIVGSVWALFNVFAVLASVAGGHAFCAGNYVELTQNCIDFLLSMMNVTAFLAGAIQFTQAQADVNQGQSILEVTTIADRRKFELVIAMCFFNFLWYAVSIGASLRLYTISNTN